MSASIIASLRELFARDTTALLEEVDSTLATDRTKISGQALALVRPDREEDICKLVGLAREFHFSLVPSGGRTGLAGGAVAVSDRPVVLLSFSRLAAFKSFDPHTASITVGAGMTLAELQRQALERGYFFPVDFAAAGTAQVGGAIATNAGGIHFLRYGGMRSRVRGLRCINGRGDLLSFPGEVLKNNTGYDLKELIIGSEGTLALVTEATLGLSRPPGELALALAAFSDFDQVLQLLEDTRPYDLHAFECFDAESLLRVMNHLQIGAPFTRKFPWYALLEFEMPGPEPLERLSLLEHCRLVETAGKRKDLWRYREAISESIHGEVGSKQDVSLPPRMLSAFVKEIRALAHSLDLTLCIFGHVADGNLHVNVLGGEAAALSLSEEILRRVRDLGGSISAEHGIGLLKKTWLPYTRSPAEIEIMRQVKRVFDPDLVLNPGKIFD
ncbi:MAG: FAD-binding oxidoreductase [Spirochaetales bacterium]|nr:FAD-binding oxidoreductase [Spirochaetales bacterium]